MVAKTKLLGGQDGNQFFIFGCQFQYSIAQATILVDKIEPWPSTFPNKNRSIMFTCESADYRCIQLIKEGCKIIIL